MIRGQFLITPFSLSILIVNVQLLISIRSPFGSSISYWLPAGLLAPGRGPATTRRRAVFSSPALLFFWDRCLLIIF